MPRLGETSGDTSSSMAATDMYSLPPNPAQMQRLKIYADWAAGKLELEPYQLSDMRKYAEVRRHPHCLICS